MSSNSEKHEIQIKEAFVISSPFRPECIPKMFYDCMLCMIVVLNIVCAPQGISFPLRHSGLDELSENDKMGFCDIIAGLFAILQIGVHS